MNVLRKNNRKAQINILCSDLGISRDERHDIQLAVTGKDSLTAMSLPELDDVLNHLHKIKNGKKPEDEWRFVFRLAVERQSYAKKIYRLAQRIGALQKPPVPVMSKAYIEGVAEQMMRADTVLEFCDCAQLHKIVQALEVFVKRHGG
jgi:phage gp16-like protein